MCPNCGQTKFGVLLKPNTLNRIKCPKCKNTTYVYISENLDVLTFDEDELCDECGGSGKCPECGGTGEVLCPKCKGSGLIVGFDFLPPRTLVAGCKECGGIGHWVKFKEREEVKGTGKVKCKKCKGSGVCPKCNGLRFKR